MTANRMRVRRENRDDDTGIFVERQTTQETTLQVRM